MSKLGFFPDTWMGRGVCTSGSAPLTDTFLMARRHTIWPVLNTAETGTWAWSGDSGKMFGGTYTNTSNTANDSFSLENLNLFSATAAINLLYTKASTGGLCDVYWGTKGEAGDLLATIDMYAASTQKNQVAQFSLGTVTKARKALHFVMRAGTGGGYTCQIQQAEVVQLTGSNLGTSIDDLPWWVDVPPFAYSAGSGNETLFINTSYAWGSLVDISDNLNDYVEYKAGLAHGTYSLDTVVAKSTTRGIIDFTLNGGSSLGTIDTYGFPAEGNVRETVSGISVSSAGVQTLRLTVNDQNPSATGYNAYVYWQQFRKTSAHGAITPTGATYGRETMELWPWFADTTDYSGFVITSVELHYGIYRRNPPFINDSQHFETSIKSGTYDVDIIGTRYTDQGIVHLSQDGGADIDTVDMYGSLARAVTFTMTGSLAPGLIDLSMDSKNASSSDYYGYMTMIRLTRTGA